MNQKPHLHVRGLHRWSWPFLDYRTLTSLKRRAQYKDIAKCSKFKAKLYGFFFTN